MISLLVKQMLEFSMNKQEETAPKSQLWCKYTFAKEQQSSLSNAACPRTVGGPWKVRGNAAELTRRACGWSPDTWWGTLSSLSCFHLFVTHSSCLAKKQHTENLLPPPSLAYFRPFKQMCSLLKNKSGVYFHQYLPSSYSSPKDSNSFLLKAQLHWVLYQNSKSRLSFGRTFGKSAHS